MHIIFALLSCLLPLYGSQLSARTDSTSKNEIRVMPVARTPESNTVMLRIAVPKSGEIVSGNPVWMQFRIDGYSLGSDSSQFGRASEIALSPLGQTVHVIVDNEPYFPVMEPAINPFNEEGWYYTTGYKFKLPIALKPGMHILRAFPARSFGESLKGDNTFQVTPFFVGEATQFRKDIDLTQPYLTYNEPSGQIALTTDKPVLLDFLIANCELTPDGYKVRLTIDGSENRMITSWQPYYIYGLSSGKHTIRLELLNGNAKVRGSFNDVERTIQVR